LTANEGYEKMAKVSPKQRMFEQPQNRQLKKQLKPKRSKSLLLALLNSLADYDGELSEAAIGLLDELNQHSEPIPPLYADVFLLPYAATCADLVERIKSLSQEQVAIASYAFQIFRFYEQMLRVNTTETSPQQKAAYESQMERIRLSVARTKAALVESLGQRPEQNL
jgi:hypothetical protein